MEDLEFENIVYPGSSGPSSCGYCSSPGQRRAGTGYHAATLDAVKLTPSVYQKMIDRGWRRSGTYCYKPDLKKCCCPQYTIKLDALKFEPTRSHRQLLNRFNRFVIHGEQETAMELVTEPTGNKKRRVPIPPKIPPSTTLPESVHLAEDNIHPHQETKHIFEIILEPSSYTPEKYALYEKYQADIHNDVENSTSGFKRFLVESPLTPERIPYTKTRPEWLPEHYGSYHQLYKLDGQIIAMAVLDILPKCVSSVYFMYDKTWERFSLGKLSALREISLAQEIKDAGVESMEALYMGFYIYSCPKMRYKAEYSPSFLVDPETYEWYPLDTCLPLLEQHRYACFSDPSHSFNNENPIPDSIPDLSPGSTIYQGIQVLARIPSGEIIAVPIQRTRYLEFAQVQREMESCVSGLGSALAGEICFTL